MTRSDDTNTTPFPAPTSPGPACGSALLPTQQRTNSWPTGLPGQDQETQHSLQATHSDSSPLLWPYWPPHCSRPETHSLNMTGASDLEPQTHCSLSHSDVLLLPESQHSSSETCPLSPAQEGCSGQRGGCGPRIPTGTPKGTWNSCLWRVHICIIRCIMSRWQGCELGD